METLKKILHLVAAFGISLSLFGGVASLANPADTGQAMCAVFRAPVEHLPRREPLVMLAMR